MYLCTFFESVNNKSKTKKLICSSNLYRVFQTLVGISYGNEDGDLVKRSENYLLQEQGLEKDVSISYPFHYTCKLSIPSYLTFLPGINEIESTLLSSSSLIHEELKCNDFDD